MEISRCRPGQSLARALVALAAPLLLALSGCSSGVQTCTVNGDCAKGSACVSQKCVVTKVTDAGSMMVVPTTCQMDADCSGSTPLCNAATRLCVQCNTTADCGGDANKTCTSHACVLKPGVCEANSDCAATPSTPICDTTSNACVGCTVNGDCTNGTVCSSATEMCVQCLTTADCPNGQACSNNNTCVSTSGGCTMDADCAVNAAGAYCNTATSTCVQCNTNVDCGGGKVCTANVCGAAPAGCTSDAMCTGNLAGPHCNGISMQCVECVQNSHCTGGKTCNFGTGVCQGGTTTDGGTHTDAGTTVTDGGTHTDGGTTVTDGGTTVSDGGTTVSDAGTTVTDAGTPPAPGTIGTTCGTPATPPVQGTCATGYVCESVYGLGMCSKPCNVNGTGSECGDNGTEANYCPSAGFCFAGCSSTQGCPSPDFACDLPVGQSSYGSCLPKCTMEPAGWCGYGFTCNATTGACDSTACDPSIMSGCSGTGICYTESDLSQVCVERCTSTSCPTGTTCSSYDHTCNDFYARCGAAYSCQGSTACITSVNPSNGLCLAACNPANGGYECPTFSSYCDIRIVTGTLTEYFCAIECSRNSDCPAGSGTTCKLSGGRNYKTCSQ